MERENWIYRSNALFIGFIPLFTIGGVTGVMLAMSAADYQYHNTMFLVAHFHNTIIPGVVFAMLAGLTYYWPKMFGFMLNERIGKWTFWLLSIGFILAFFPMYITGLDGQARRMYTYSESTGFGTVEYDFIYRGRYHGNCFCINRI